jgi:hypothetical protein
MMARARSLPGLPLHYTGLMTRSEVKDILERILKWSTDDQAKILQFVRELEQWLADHDSVDDRELTIGRHQNA